MNIRTIFETCQFSFDKMQKVNLFATTELFLDLYCLEPGQKQKVHTHEDSSKFYVVLEGRARIQIADETTDVGAGQTVIARAGEQHGVENTTPDRLVLLVGMAPPPTHA